MTSTAPLHFLILLIASWIGRQQGEAIEYLRAENLSFAGIRSTSTVDPCSVAVEAPETLLRLLLVLLASLRSAVRSRSDLVLENLALRQQLAVLARRRPRPRVDDADRWFWIALRRVWSRWSETLLVVRPETVVRWHRAGFRRYWAWLSRRRSPGRPPTEPSVRELIGRMAADNPTWGAPRIHGELRMLGIDVSERTVSTRQRRGSFNNCARRFPSTRRHGI